MVMVVSRLSERPTERTQAAQQFAVVCVQLGKGCIGDSLLHTAPLLRRHSGCASPSGPTALRPALRQPIRRTQMSTCACSRSSDRIVKRG